MYLKALEIQGFKSFPDKIRLGFEERVCGIVGPNGSGKSNISDAICWVLGEQRSKALRGSKMEDVLFGGSADRAEAGFAQVSLILGNEERSLACDADEVVITRRYYRSGDSEYYINKSMVRLKDINQLLMDTGLGRDGYSLVGQGRVDAILAAKSTERREVFEEAAGISKYRYQREEAVNKLEKAADSLLRVGDKISELELQREPLKKQAEDARQYLVMRDELRGLEISLWMDSLDKLASENRILVEDYETAEQSLNSSKEELETLYSASETFSEEIRAADEAAERIRAEIGLCEGEAGRLEREAALIEADIKSNESAIERLEGEDQHQHEREAELKGRLEERRARLTELQKQAAALSLEREELTGKLRAAEEKAARAEADAVQTANASSETERGCAAAEARLEVVQNTIRTQKSRSTEADDERKRLEERLKAELALQVTLETGLQQQREETAAAEAADQQQKTELAEKKKRGDEISEALRQLKLKEGAVNSRLSLLKEMEQEYEGFSKAVRVIMREHESGRLNGIHGTVADLIRTDDRYTVAIETALGASLQSIVVSREEDGKAAIQLLKQRDAGRGTFLPLSSIRGSTLQERGIEQAEGVEGIASNLVRFDEKYRSIVENLLGRTVIAVELDSAIALSRRYGGRFRIVTLDGQVMNAGGSMTGGSSARNVGILSRSNELNRLSAQHETILKRIGDGETAAGKQAEEIAAAEQAAEQAAQQLRILQDGLLKKESELKQRKMLTEAVKTSLKAAEDTLSKAEQDEEAMRLSVRAAEDEISEKRKQLETLHQRLKEADEQKRLCTQALKELTDTAAGLSTREAALETERQSVEAGLREWEELLSGYSEDKLDRETLRKTLQAKNEKLRQEYTEKNNAALEEKKKTEAQRPALQQALEKRQSAEARRGENERRAQEQNRKISELERQYSELSRRKLAVDMEEKQILDKLWDSYELSRTAAQQQRMKLESPQKASKRSGQLRRLIAAMGTPNLGAIAEFDRIDERYAYLTDQRKDIMKAKRELEQVISALTSEMEAIFSREFTQVADSFRQTFSELFGGGKGEIYLEDPEHILECGIEIRVQPPGKSLRALTLLSGGERAFVAIALYFAMLKVRPAPFCVLDEIESALDEANVVRFAKYLRNMIEHTQFLYITHRRGSMEEADMLYGVTMQKGVSKVLRVDLAEALRTTDT